MKTTFKYIAAGTFMVLLLLAGKINANETELRTYNTKINESALQLENWMTNETTWKANSLNNANFVLATETELQLEGWMTNENIWNTEEIGMDTDLVLENWMLDSNVWN